MHPRTDPDHSRPQQQQAMHFFFLKPDFKGPANGAHYAGGQHGYVCAAQSLAAAGHNVHLLYTATKMELMITLMQQGCMGSFSYSSAVEGVTVWSHQGISHHVSLSDAEASTAQQLSTSMAALCNSSHAPTLSTPHQRLFDECSTLLRSQHTQPAPSMPAHTPQPPASPACWVVLDADGSQAPLPSNSSSLMEAGCAVLPPKVLLLLVQNIHFLPLGPQGTAPRTPALLHSWAQLGGVLCISSFVARYIAQHAVPLGLPPQRIYCMHFAAFGAFGSGPFLNHGTAAAQHLPWPSGGSSTYTPQHSSSITSAQHQQQHPSVPPTIGCLKLTPEKGGVLFLKLAQALPELRFLAVCADPGLQAMAAQLPNVRTVPPGDVDSLLQHMTVLLAPSLWQEAYGMVVTEAILRGIPVIVSDQGGLSEAACGCPAAVVPVQPMQLPEVPGPSGPTPSWQARVLPEDQELAGWVQALQRLLGRRDVYEGCSSAGRDAALRVVHHQGLLLEQMVVWLGQLAN